MRSLNIHMITLMSLSLFHLGPPKAGGPANCFQKNTRSVPTRMGYTVTTINRMGYTVYQNVFLGKNTRVHNKQTPP